MAPPPFSSYPSFIDTQRTGSLLIYTEAMRFVKNREFSHRSEKTESEALPSDRHMNALKVKNGGPDRI